MILDVYGGFFDCVTHVWCVIDVFVFFVCVGRVLLVVYVLCDWCGWRCLCVMVVILFVVVCD